MNAVASKLELQALGRKLAAINRAAKIQPPLRTVRTSIHKSMITSTITGTHMIMSINESMRLLCTWQASGRFNRG
jgi:hypothetical protein